MVDTTAASMSPGWTPALVLRNVLAFAANMLQVYGVLYWGWDIFQILMLYWMETAVIGFWALLRPRTSSRCRRAFVSALCDGI